MFKFFENLSDIKKVIAYWCSLYGIVLWPFLLNVSPTWEYLLKGFGGVIFAGMGVFAGLLISDLYKLKIKHKLFKTKEDGSEKESKTDNQRVA